MSAGLLGLLDDVAALARLAAASVDDVGAAAGRAGVKAAGVVVDDTAVTPQYVRGVTAERELPIIRRIAVGSLRNKLVLILPVALLLSALLPWLLTPVLMVGGTYLCVEGVEKVWGRLAGHEERTEVAARVGPEAERAVVSGAIRTDFILSAEIMVIALNEVAGEPLVARAVILAVVAVGITVLVYGVVALIVRTDDLGLLLAGRPGALTQRVGRSLVAAMPRLLAVITVVGTAAMLWVGGHILLVGADELGWHAPYALVHHLAETAGHALPAGGAVLGWLVGTLASAAAGTAVGAVGLTLWHVMPFSPAHRGSAPVDGGTGGGEDSESEGNSP